MEEEFSKAALFLQGSSAKTDNATKLRFYGLYKQATQGPCTSSAPSRLKVVAFHKHKAHLALGKIDKEEAMKVFLEEVRKLNPDWNSPKARL